MKRILILAIAILVVVIVIVVVRWNTGPRYNPDDPVPGGTPTPSLNQ